MPVLAPHPTASAPLGSAPLGSAPLGSAPLGAAAGLAVDFLARARHEALRYGPDPWVWVRELVQNARDAGATSCTFDVRDDGEHTVVICRDDGDGMSFAHAKDFLFSLYASSKDGAKNQAGRFGVGFWSILRFEPTRLRIRSRAAGQIGWQVELDGGLTQAWVEEKPDLAPGTEVALVRPRGDGHDAARIADAARQNARFVSQRRAPGQPLRIAINGQAIEQAMALPAPSSSFAGKGMRGVVALGESPGVELFCRGLRVRVAATLDDLLAPGAASQPSRVRFVEVPDALAPRVLIDSDDLELLLSRSDARESPALTRLIGLAHQHLQRLIARQLNAMQPPSWRERMRGVSQVIEAMPTLWKLAFGAATGATLAVALAWAWWIPTTWHSAGAAPSASHLPVASDGAESRKSAESRTPRTIAKSSDELTLPAFGDNYNGPTVDTLPAGGAGALALHYAPVPDEPLYLRLLTVDNPGAAERMLARRRLATTEDQGACDHIEAKCLTIEVDIAASSVDHAIEIPLPVNGRIVASSLTFNGQPVSAGLMGHVHGDLALALAKHPKSKLRYQVEFPPNLPMPAKVAAPRHWPEAFEQARRDFANGDRNVREFALAWVREHVRYSTALATVKAHESAIAEREPFLTRSLRIGGGDCDVQNGVLVLLLRAFGQRSRLALGYVGREGSVPALPHAWAEVFEPKLQRWLILDASPSLAAAENTSQRVAPLPARTERLAVARPPTATTATHVAAPASDSEPVPARQPLPILAWLALSAPLTFAVLSTLYAWRHRRLLAGKVELAQGLAPFAMLAGALRQPESYRHLPEIFERKLLPSWGQRSPISLAHAREQAKKGQLFLARTPVGWIEPLQRTRCDILDARDTMAEKLAQSLGALDLDAWDKVVAQHVDEPLLRSAQAQLDAALGGIALIASPEHRGALTRFDLANWQRWRHILTCRYLVMDPHDPLLEHARTAYQAFPEHGTFVLLSGLQATLGLPTAATALLLERSAQAVFFRVAP